MTYLWNEADRSWSTVPGYKYRRLSGMLWKGGVLWYKWRPGPSSLFWHTMSRMLLVRLKDGMSCGSSLFDPRPLPAASGNTINFVTYSLGA